MYKCFKIIHQVNWYGDSEKLHKAKVEPRPSRAVVGRITTRLYKDVWLSRSLKDIYRIVGTLEKFSVVLGNTQAHMDMPGEATREGQPNSNSSIRINTSPLRF